MIDNQEISYVYRLDIGGAMVECHEYAGTYGVV